MENGFDYQQFYFENFEELLHGGVRDVEGPSGRWLRFTHTGDSVTLIPLSGMFTSLYCEVSRSRTMTAALFSRYSNGEPIHPDIRAGRFLRAAIYHFDPQFFCADWLINQPPGMSTYGQEYMSFRQTSLPYEAALLTGCGRMLDEMGYILHLVEEKPERNLVLAHFRKPRY